MPEAPQLFGALRVCSHFPQAYIQHRDGQKVAGFMNSAILYKSCSLQLSKAFLVASFLDSVLFSFLFFNELNAG